MNTRTVAEAKTTSQVLLCISARNRAEVDDIASKAGAAADAIEPSPEDEYDFMYGRSFEDPRPSLGGELDGHGNAGAPVP